MIRSVLRDSDRLAMRRAPRALGLTLLLVGCPGGSGAGDDDAAGSTSQATADASGGTQSGEPASTSSDEGPASTATTSGSSGSSGDETSTETGEADSTSSDSSGEEALVVDCPTYCALMEEHCATDMIHPLEACESLCDHPQVSLFDGNGTVADESGNTLGCRIHHAAAAADLEGAARAEACAAANLSGGDVCGSFCENYCLLSMEACSDGNPQFGLPQPNFPGVMACQMACTSMATDVLPGTAQPEQLFGYGDTVQCRLHHLHAASEMDMYDLHCPHASESSTSDTCSDTAPPNLANYCAFATGYCTGDNALFEPGASVGDCMAAIEPFVMDGTYDQGPFGSFTDDAGATLGCLNYWIVQTPWDPETLCAAADWDPAHWQSNGGAGVCDGG